jgi:GntR family transcriptional regulator/MocR family aminotransferase
MRRTSSALISNLALDPDNPDPLHRQLYFALREAILSGRLASGVKLPATRVLARDLAVSRNTVAAAYDQLLAEGYVAARTGSGTFVTEHLPDALLRSTATGRAPLVRRTAPRLSRRGAAVAAIGRPEPSQPRPFAPGLPELDLFPMQEWARLLARHWRRPSQPALLGGDPAGERPLRQAVAAYLGAARSVRCDADQVIIVSGSQQAIDLVARLLIDPDAPVWVEEPGYAGTRGALTASGARVVPVPVDGEGLDVAAGIARASDARLACVSPSHQFPLGVTMSPARRLALLDWAASHDAFVLEDDYDSEYRYAGRPLASLQGMDDQARVFYVGTFSKVMFPALRLGYLVAPADLVDPLLAVRRHVDTQPSSVAQAALTDFIADGHLASHIRRMRVLYAERLDAFYTLASHRLDGLLAIDRPDSGMHVIGYLPDGVDDHAVCAAVRSVGVEAAPLSRLYLEEPRRHGLMLGFAATPVTAMAPALDRLARAVERTASP